MPYTRQTLRLSAIALSLLALASCGSDDDNSNDDAPLQCSNDQVLNDAGDTCVDPAPVEPTTPTCDDGQVLNEDSQQCETPVDVEKPDPVYFPAADEAVIYLNREHIDQSYDGWVLHLWNACGTGGWDSQVTDTATAPTNWPDGPAINGMSVDPIYGAYWVLNLEADSSCGNWIIHNAAGDNQTNDFTLAMNGDGEFARMAFVIGNDNMRNASVSNEPICVNPSCEASNPPVRNIRNASAHWLDEDTIIWDNDGAGDEIFVSTTGGLSQDTDGNITGSDFSGSLTATALTDEQKARVPHLADWSAFMVSDLTAEQIKAAPTGQIWVTGSNVSGGLVGTEVQTPRLLDALYTMGDNDADEASLGVHYDADNVSVSVWAPTAQNVELVVFDADSKAETARHTMTADTNTGIWSHSGTRTDLDRKLYRFHVTVYDRSQDSVVTTESVDPYSVAASADSLYSMFVDLNDADTQPDGWGTVAVPALAAPETMIVYEGHVRDFSIRDDSTSEANRGKYLAFTESGTAPIEHLAELKASGLTHFHMLPTNDFLTVPETEAARIELTDTVAKLCGLATIDGVCGVEPDASTLMDVLNGYTATSDDAKNLIDSIRQMDGFNWGYDPVLYNVPEGSYASSADGVARIKEMRAMNQALNQMGLRTVMDVVYNHTIQSGLTARGSTFDKVVPGYYFRRDPVSGGIENASGAGNDTAPENRMFAKFIQDSVVHWATHYGYNDFRFDLMTFLPKQVIVDTLAQVQSDVQADSYFYGEGWNMPGSSANDAIFERAEQFNMAGTGVGTFNDRMRDPMRFLALMKGENVDRIRIGLAGNLKDYEMYNSSSQLVTADTIGAYGEDPQESVNYVSKHDNETLWDMIQKEGAVSSDMSASDRARIQNMTVAMTTMSQGVPFIHMGSDLLRSKSMDRNTYDASDWYNLVDFTQATNNWAIGMPLDIGDASEEWVRTQFGNANTAASATDIALASDVFNEFVEITQSSPLFALETLDDVQARLGFHNTGSDQVDGIIAMSLDDGTGVTDIDDSVDALMVIFNGNDSEKTFTIRSASGFSLHPVQQASADNAVRGASFSEESVMEDEASVTYGSFTVPAYTAAVFVKAQSGAQSEGIAADATVPGSAGVAKPYDVVTYLRGEMNNWGTDTPFTYNGDGTYTAFATLQAQAYSFKFASDDWATVNFGGVSSSDATVNLNEAEALAATDTNLSFTPASAGEYRFTIDADDAQAPSLTISPADVYAEAIYLKGSMNGWENVNEMLYVDQGLYRLTLTLAAGDFEFKIADSTWNVINIGAGDSGANLETSANLSLVVSSNPNNIQLSVETAGEYIFTLDTRDSAKPTVHLVPSKVYEVPVYIRGSMNGWSTGNAMAEAVTNIYSVDITLAEGGYEWKVASEDWNTVDLTAAGLVELVTPAGLIPGAGQPNSTFVVDEEAMYRFTMDAHFAPPRVTVVPVPVVAQ